MFETQYLRKQTGQLDLNEYIYIYIYIYRSVLISGAANTIEARA